MRAIEQFVRRHASGTAGVATYLLRYRVAGWNGAAADAYADVRWALEQLRAEHGSDVPIVLVGHSMGGRAALRAGGDRQVAAVCALAPWTPPGEPVEHLRGQTVTILHGRGDRWVPAGLSADFALRAREAGVPRWPGSPSPAGTRCCAAPAAGTGSRGTPCSAASGIEPMRADIANALRRPVPGGHRRAAVSARPDPRPGVPPCRVLSRALRLSRRSPSALWSSPSPTCGRSPPASGPVSPAMRAWHHTLGARDVVSGAGDAVRPAGPGAAAPPRCSGSSPTHRRGGLRAQRPDAPRSRRRRVGAALGYAALNALSLRWAGK